MNRSASLSQRATVSPLLLVITAILSAALACGSKAPAPTVTITQTAGVTLTPSRPAPTEGAESAALPTHTPTPEPTTAAPVQVTPGTADVVYHSGDLELKGWLCTPEGVGPFPAVLYNHGGLGDQIGGAPLETCEELARDGFVGFSPIRRQTVPLEGHLDDVLAGVDYVKGLPYVDSRRLGIIGFSRGGMLTYFAAAARPADFKAIVIMAAAEEILGRYQSQTGDISAPVLLLVSENDRSPHDHVRVMLELKAALEAAGKEVEFIMYPPFGNDGHLMFFEVGDYWSDVQEFLQTHLGES